MKKTNKLRTKLWIDVFLLSFTRLPIQEAHINANNAVDAFDNKFGSDNDSGERKRLRVYRVDDSYVDLFTDEI